MKDCRGEFSIRLRRQWLPIGIVLIATMLIAGCAVTKMNSSPTPGPSAGQLAVSPANMTFGSVNVGASTSQPGTLTAGASAITVSSASWNGTGYSLGGITFPITVPAGQIVPFTVTFAPQASGTVPGAVSFLSNATNSPSVEQWSGSGVQTGQHQVALTWNRIPQLSRVTSSTAEHKPEVLTPEFPVCSHRRPTTIPPSRQARPTTTS
jgi:hypothetical protein